MRILLRDLAPGTNYGIQLRGTDGANYAEWSKIFKFTTATKTIAPATPANFTWTVQGRAFLATWDAVIYNSNGSALKDLKTYRLTVTDGVKTVKYETTATRFELTYEMNKAAFGTPKASLTASVTAVDLSGNESVATSSILVANPAPASPANFTASGIQDGVSLKWDAVSDDDLEGYRVYMSTVSSGFTPGPSNLIWKGNATSALITTFSYGVTHYFKLAAYDSFGTDSTYASSSATPTSSFGSDTTPPSAPTGLTLTPSVNSSDNSLMDVKVQWTAPVATDLGGYRVRYRPNGSTAPWQVVTVAPDVTEALVTGLSVGVTYDFQVQAYDFSANASSYTATSSTSLSNSAPSKPSTPTLTGTTLAFAVSHNMQKAAGGQLENDVVALRVYTNSSDTYTGGTVKETLNVSQGTPVAVSRTIIGPSTGTIYVWVTAVDKGGLESTQSDRVSVTTSTLSGTFIQDATITNAKINDLAANKITAGTGIVNDLLIKSKLEVSTGGKIQSALYTSSAGASGFYLDDTSLIIKSGAIEAAALKIQNAPNLVPAQYAGFEFTSTFYGVRAASGAAGTNPAITVDGSTVGSINVAISSAQVKYESQSLLIQNTSGTNRTVKLAPADNNYPIRVESGKKYIISAYVYNGTGTTQNFTIGCDNFVGPNPTQVTALPNAAWTRVVLAQAAAGSEYSQIYFIVPTGTTFYVDGVQLEEQTGAITIPSAWKPPGATSIDGSIIRTGEIRSSSNVVVNGISQPAWSINTQGGAQLGTVNVRGSLLIGASGGSDLDAGSSVVQSANWVNGVSGWRIASDGNAQFNNLDAYGTVRSTNYVEGEAGWQVSQDGNAQFQNLAVLEELGVDTLNADTINVADVNGDIRNLATDIIPNLARIIGYGSRATSGGTISTGSTSVMEFRMQCKANYLYIIETSSLTMNFASANGRARAFIKYTTNSTKPTTSSSTLKSADFIGGPTSGNSSNTLRKLYKPGTDTDLWLLLGYSQVASGNIFMTSDDTLGGTTIEMFAYEVGPADNIGVDQSGAGGGGSSPIQTYTKKYTATWSKSYRSSGAQRTDNAHLYQGYVDSFNGNQWSLAGFNYTQIASDLSGATVTSCKLTYKCLHAYYSSGVSVKIGTHNFTAAPGTWNGTGQNDNIAAQTSKSGTAYTVELGTTVGNNFKSGTTARGVCFGPTTGDNAHYAYMGGASEAPPYLTITYRK